MKSRSSKLTRLALLFWTAVSLSGCASTLDDEPADVASLHQEIVNGLAVNGAGVDESWEGIVQVWLGEVGAMTGGRCSGFFITGSHIITAAHCIPHNGGRFDVQYQAPSLAWTALVGATITVPSCFNGQNNRSCDIAVITLDAPEPWATADRCLRLYGGPTIEGTFLHAYGYGFTRNGEGAPADFLMTAPNKAAFELEDHTDGYFETTAGPVNICHGDSGGPAVWEPWDPASPPIVWGVLSKFKQPTGKNRNCVSDGNLVAYAKTNTNRSFIESVLGFACVADVNDSYRCF